MTTVTARASHAPSTQLHVDDTEPDEAWKNDLRERIHASMVPMIEEAAAQRDSELARLRQYGINESQNEQINRTHETTVSRYRRLAQEQYQIALERERQERRWAAGQEVNPAWSDAMIKEQQSIMDSIKREDGQASRSQTRSNTLGNSDHPRRTPGTPVAASEQAQGYFAHVPTTHEPETRATAGRRDSGVSERSYAIYNPVGTPSSERPLERRASLNRPEGMESGLPSPTPSLRPRSGTGMATPNERPPDRRRPPPLTDEPEYMEPYPITRPRGDSYTSIGRSVASSPPKIPPEFWKPTITPEQDALMSRTLSKARRGSTASMSSSYRAAGGVAAERMNDPGRVSEGSRALDPQEATEREQATRQENEQPWSGMARAREREAYTPARADARQSIGSIPDVRAGDRLSVPSPTSATSASPTRPVDIPSRPYPSPASSTRPIVNKRSFTADRQSSSSPSSRAMGTPSRSPTDPRYDRAAHVPDGYWQSPALRTRTSAQDFRASGSPANFGGSTFQQSFHEDSEEYEDESEAEHESEEISDDLDDDGPFHVGSMEELELQAARQAAEERQRLETQRNAEQARKRALEAERERLQKEDMKRAEMRRIEMEEKRMEEKRMEERRAEERRVEEKRAEKAKRLQDLKLAEETRRKAELALQREEEMKRREEDLKRREEELERREAESRRREEEKERIEAELREREEEIKRLQREEMLRLKEEELNRRELEARRVEAEAKRKEAEAKRKEAEVKQKEAEAKRLAKEARKREADARRQQREAELALKEAERRRESERQELEKRSEAEREADAQAEREAAEAQAAREAQAREAKAREDANLKREAEARREAEEREAAAEAKREREREAQARREAEAQEAALRRAAREEELRRDAKRRDENMRKEYEQQAQELKRREEEFRRRQGSFNQGQASFNINATDPNRDSYTAGHRAASGTHAWSSASSFASASSTGAPSSNTSRTSTSSTGSKTSSGTPRAGSGGSTTSAASGGFDEAEWARRQAEQAQKQQEKFRREQERLEAERQMKQAGKIPTKEEIVQLFQTHERQWTRIKSSTDSLTWDSFPWPMLKRPNSVEELTTLAISGYILSPLYPGDKTKSSKDRIKEHIRRWHPDRFDTQMLPRVVEAQKEKVKEGAGLVARGLSELLTRSNVHDVFS